MNIYPQNIDPVKDYFNRKVVSFDGIYSGEKNYFQRFLDRILRRDMYERFRRTFEVCKDVSGKNVLDVGCGSGRYGLEFARQGAARVANIDIAKDMVVHAKRLAQEEALEEGCEFIVGDFLEYDFPDPFDFVIAIGFFDYIADARPFLRKMSSLTLDRFVATFPVKWTYRMPIRRVRLALLGCPVYFYTKNQVYDLLQEASFGQVTIERIGHIYFVTAISKARDKGTG